MSPQRLKIWAGIIGIVVTNAATLTTALLAYNKEEKEPTAKATYEELSKAVSEISEDNVNMHKDLSNIRGYLAGLAAQGTFQKNEKYIPKKRPKSTKPKSVEPPPIKAKPKKYRPPPIVKLNTPIKLNK